MEEKQVAKRVYAAICDVQGEMAKIGISKEHKNTQGSGYMFRGIDDVYNALAPLLAKYKLCILPRVIKRDVTERISKAGGNLFYINLDVEFDFVSAEDGSIHTARISGEAMDSGDKGTNKAVSAAYKYLCFQTFCIPIDGDNDADAQTHEVQPKLNTQDTDKGKMAPPATKTPPQASQTASDGIKTATGLVLEIGEPNKGGYQAITIEGFQNDKGYFLKFATKDKIILETITARKEAGEKIHIEYETVVNGKYTNYNIVGLVNIQEVDEVGF